jgi:hypothetical protein
VLAVTVSVREPYTWHCEECDRRCLVPVWRIVDARERADVLESPDGPRVRGLSFEEISMRGVVMYAPG